MTGPSITLHAALLAAALAAGGAGAQPAGDYGARFAALCAACHGADGRSPTPGTPSLAGQHSFYAVTQLYLFRAGRRTNPEMTAVGKTLSDDDLRGFSDWIGRLPPLPPLPALAPTPADPLRMARAQALAQRHQCASCHGADFAGGGQVPRLAGQHQDYLRRTLHEFRAGQRTGYTQAMNEALSGLSPQDLDDLAHALARAGARTPP